MLCGTKSDKREITLEEGKHLQDELKFYEYVECSAFLFQNVTDVFEEALAGAIEAKGLVQ